MGRLIVFAACVTSALMTTSGEAATLTANYANYKKVFSSAKAGDTIRLIGKFGRTAMANRAYSSTVTIDARAATFTDALSFKHVTNVALIGGHYGTMSKTNTARVQVFGGKQISILDPIITNNRGGSGIVVQKSSGVTVSGGTFTSLGLAIGFTSVTGGKIYNNKSINSSSDGFNVADSHNVLVSRNSCTGTSLNPGSKAHPDCVQLWSIKGNAVQSDIEISDNFASGATQGFTSFNAFAGGGLRIKILRNRVDISYPQGIACYSCVDSQIVGNILTTQSGAKWRTNINIVGGRNNIISGNSIGALDKSASNALAMESLAVATPWDQATLNELKAADFTDVENMLNLRSAVTAGGIDPRTAAATAVPEPAVWVMLVSGFGLAGAAARRRRVKIVPA